ncbi:MAG: methyltransferase [Oscillospiraceae bacterium]|jgi:tRNA1(Val) A37 N6-methylase TrmN6|nr:methyltransferase [Oscillospiraceae bacterium]
MDQRELPCFAEEPLGAGEKLEPLSAGFSVITSAAHTFNTDTILLANYSMPRRNELCADFGTGCGTIPLLWCARSCPRQVYAVELQQEACLLARRSVRLNRLEDQVQIVQEDINTLRQTRSLPLNLDLIACNPPYQPNGAGHQNNRPERRIARHEVACSFSNIAAVAAAFLRWGGRFVFCLRPERLCAAMLTLHAAGLEPKRLRFVQQRAGKAPFLFLMQAVRGGRPGLTVEPVLLIESKNGGWSEEMLEIYGDYKEGRG